MLCYSGRRLPANEPGEGRDTANLKGVKFQLCEHEPAANAGKLLEKLHRDERDQ